MQEAFSFAAPAEVLDGIKLCSGHIYGGLLARLDGVEATKLMNCWCTSVKDVWGVSRDNHRSFARWLVNGNTTIREELFSRWPKFLQSLLTRNPLAGQGSSHLHADDNRSQQQVDPGQLGAGQWPCQNKRTAPQRGFWWR